MTTNRTIPGGEPIIRYKLRLPPLVVATAQTNPLAASLHWHGGLGPLHIERSVGRFSQTFTAIAGTFNASDGTLIDTKVVAGQHYRYRVKAVMSSASTPYSLIHDVRTAGLRADYVAPDSGLNRTAPQPKWTFSTIDGSDSYTFDRNPNTEGNPYAERTLTWSVMHPGATYTALRGGRSPVRWEFSGILHDRRQHEMLRHWISKGEKFYITTDLGEIHIARLLSYTPSQKGGGSNNDRATWTATALIYDEIPLVAKFPQPQQSARVAGDVARLVLDTGDGYVSALIAVAGGLVQGPTAEVDSDAPAGDVTGS